MSGRQMSAAANIAAGCEGKKRFTSFSMAARTASKSAHRNAVALEPYACERCGGFHVGSRRAPASDSSRTAGRRVARRCDECRAAGTSFCEHNRVLIVFIDAAPVTILSATEERARVTACRLRMKLKGKPFNPPRFAVRR